MRTRELSVDTATRRVVDLTAEVRAFCRGAGDGLLSVFLPHATAGLALIEVGAGSEVDLEHLLEHLLPREDRHYTHRHGSRGHGADHLLPALVSPSLVIPVFGGVPVLGRWQSVVLVDLNPDNPVRTVRLSLLEG
jgi:secondary thiamine-phosphate synthase enzyme